MCELRGSGCVGGVKLRFDQVERNAEGLSRVSLASAALCSLYPTSHPLLPRHRSLLHAGPSWVDVTWGAGGSTSELTLDISTKLKKEFNMEPNMHLTW